MLSVKQVLVLGIAVAPSALAHTLFTNFHVNGINQGNGTCVRVNKNDNAINSPVPDVGGTDMACGISGLDPVARTCPIPDGASVVFQFDSFDSEPGKEYIDPGHIGPCAIYAKKVDSPSADPTGDGWFKLWEQGYDGKKWCTQNLIDNKGLISVKLPSGLEGGYYYLRPELLALHAVAEGDPQFYTGCAQVFLEGNGNLGPDTTVAIPGYVKKTDPALTWNIYYGTDPNKYPTVGPKVSSFSPGSNLKAAQTSQTEGLKPDGCILENANWCGVEVPDYTDEDGCWKSVENCWSQNQACWDSVHGSIYDGCKISETRCNELTDTCNNKVFPGPPNKGKVLTAPKTTVNPGNIPAAGPVNGGSAPAPAPSPAPEAPAPASSSAVPPPVPSPSAAPEQPAPESVPTADEAVVPAPPAPQRTQQPAQTPTTPSPNADDNEKDAESPEPEPPATTPAPDVSEAGPVVYVTELETVWTTVDAPYTGSRLARRAHVNKHVRKMHKA